ncbi:hypothetical protein KY317_01680 [Candidatus Woesearchaeota archaeon]|nr:hypothetical protein [Candidatus Woesearchaeota archaeon]
MARSPYRRTVLRAQLADALDDVVKDIRNGGYHLKKTDDSEYELSTGDSFVIGIYLDGSNIITELKRVPDRSIESETTLMALLENDELFSHEKSPIRREKSIVRQYARLFERSFEGTKIIYRARNGVRKALRQNEKFVKCAIKDYMLRHLFLLPGSKLDEIYLK